MPPRNQVTPLRVATIHDVAALAEVSIKTVSRVLNGYTSVSPELAERVSEAIRRLDYRPNVAAVNLRRADRRTSTIGLLLEDVANPFSSALHRAIEDMAIRRGMLVFAGSGDEDPAREDELLHEFVARHVDGMIVVPAGGHRGDLLVEQQRRGTPVVLVDRVVDVLEADSVISDNRAAARGAVRHLAAHGHRRIAFLGDARSIWTASERHAGYAEGLVAEGIPYDAELVRQDFPTIELAEGAALDLLALDRPPTALFSAQNLITLGAIRALRQRGLQRSVALLGFDDLLLADLLDPPISVIAQDPRGLGHTAAELLLTRLAGDLSPYRQVVVPTRLVTRGSGEIRPRR